MTDKVLGECHFRSYGEFAFGLTRETMHPSVDGETIVIVDLPPKGTLKGFIEGYPAEFSKYHLEKIKLEKVYEVIPLTSGWSRDYYYLQYLPPSEEDLLTKLIEKGIAEGSSAREIACKLIKERV